MIRRTTRLAKFRLLRRDLGGALYRAVGILETLWHLTAESAPDGLLGRDHSDAEIEEMLGWDGEPGKLIALLARHRFLERAGQAMDGPWYVHDWHDHADRTVRRLLSRRHQTFALGHPPFGSLSEELHDGPAMDGLRPGHGHPVAGSRKQGQEAGGREDDHVRDRSRPSGETPRRSKEEGASVDLARANARLTEAQAKARENAPGSTSAPSPLSSDLPDRPRTAPPKPRSERGRFVDRPIPQGVLTGAATKE